MLNMAATMVIVITVVDISILGPEHVSAASLRDLEILECITLDRDLDVGLRWTLVERRMVNRSLRGEK